MSFIEMLAIFTRRQVTYSLLRVCLLTVVSAPNRSPTSRARMKSAFWRISRAPSVTSNGCTDGKLKRAPLSTTGSASNSANSMSIGTAFGIAPEHVGNDQRSLAR